VTTAEALARGRECFARRAWADAFAELSAADREARLEPEDLERLATAAYLTGSDEDSVEAWERAHRALLSRGDVLRAARRRPAVMRRRAGGRRTCAIDADRLPTGL
jgi:hypothetical protein